MLKLLFRIILLLVVGLGFTWLANRPGTVTINWLGQDIKMSVLVATAMLAMLAGLTYLLWQFLSKLWRSPKIAREYWRFRKHRKAYESLSRGLIAANAGDAHAAHRHATTALKTLPDEPLANLLLAQSSQLKGDRGAVKQAFEQMAKSPETEVLGLRGLFNEARQSGDLAAAIAHAEKALALNPRLAWASSATLQIQSARKDWTAAAATIAAQGKSGLLNKQEANRKRAALLTAQALAEEDTNRGRALTLANEAISLDAALVPASLVAARCHIAENNARKAMRVLREAWSQAKHEDVAQLMAYAKPGEGPEDRFERVRDLVGDPSENIEAAIALARAAISAKRLDVARDALKAWTEPSPQARICVAMAEIEEASGDKGRAREWFARAVTAQRDPMWVSDGVASPRWTPLSPVTGEIVPCEWKVPFETLAVAPHAAPEEITSHVEIKTAPEPAKPTLPPPPDDPGVDA